MTRTAGVVEWRAHRSTLLVVVALLALLAGLVHTTSQPRSEEETPPRSEVPVNLPSPVADVQDAVEVTAPTPEAPKAPSAAAPEPNSRATSYATDRPYRFLGKSTTGAETSIVLFGRGRVVNLRGPGRLDDEYVVEGIFDEYLVLRHVPTGVGEFLELAQRRQAAGPPQDAEESPRD